MVFVGFAGFVFVFCVVLGAQGFAKIYLALFCVVLDVLGVFEIFGINWLLRYCCECFGSWMIFVFLHFFGMVWLGFV